VRKGIWKKKKNTEGVAEFRDGSGELLKTAKKRGRKGIRHVLGNSPNNGELGKEFRLLPLRSERGRNNRKDKTRSHHRCSERLKGGSGGERRKRWESSDHWAEGGKFIEPVRDELNRFPLLRPDNPRWAGGNKENPKMTKGPNHSDSLRDCLKAGVLPEIPRKLLTQRDTPVSEKKKGGTCPPAKRGFLNRLGVVLANEGGHLLRVGGRGGASLRGWRLGKNT